MNPDSDLEIERALFEAALDLPSNSLRQAFLDKTCAADPALRAHLEQLLAAHVRAEDFFDFAPTVPARKTTGTTNATAQGDSPTEATHRNDPQRIGNYRITSRLGEGGCGVVYLAEQTEPVKRQVALKIIRMGMDTERVIARFALERQVLAMMNHPNIASVFDAGATDAGRPFFAMELVIGEPITTYCDQQRLPLRERLELFLQVCNAVQHAHQKGILHRDIKPSNVLVTSRDGVPSPKVIDFGVAKAVSDSAPGDEDFTIAPEQFVGTPAYMSPEQAKSGRQDVDTRSDIYSLGALLYELLVGVPPFDSKKLIASGLDEMRRTLIEVEPPLPSTVIQNLSAEARSERTGRCHCSPDELISELHRDLNWIVLRAMDKEPQRRYVTVQGLVLDLRHYLDGKPVVARPPSLLYQSTKFIHRNRIPFLAGTTVFFALIGGLGTSSWLYLRERAALKEQTRLRAIAEDSEKISRAVFFSREGDFEQANALLDDVRFPPEHPSFEGLTAYRAVGNWLGRQQRWAEAADRFAVAEGVGQLDQWRSVTLDHQSYGVALLLSGKLSDYEQFRAEHAARFANETNGDAVGRVLKICLLRPPTPQLRQQLAPLGERVEEWFAQQSHQRFNSWAAIPVALWRYREGDRRGAETVARWGYRPSDHGTAASTIRLLLALLALKDGQLEQAQPLLSTARIDLEAEFSKDDLGEGDSQQGYWYDWAFARILLEEANQMAEAMQ